MELTLIRSYFPNGTNGSLYFQNSFLCYTIELPWLFNARGHSCIPEGKYRLTMRYTTKFKSHLLINKVPDRSMILIHPANDAMAELKGCIAPVMRITGSGKGILSRMALEKINEIVFSHIDEEPVYLIIKSKNT